MLGPSPMEWIVIAALALIVLGPARLPEVARSVGRGVREMRDALQGVGDEHDSDLTPLAEHEDAVSQSDYDGEEGEDPEAELDSATEPEPPVEIDSTPEASAAAEPQQPG